MVIAVDLEDQAKVCRIRYPSQAFWNLIDASHTQRRTRGNEKGIDRTE
jgi:hypothetical protein